MKLCKIENVDIYLEIGKTLQDVTVWFVSHNKIGWMNLKYIREHRFRVAKILERKGYKIKNPSEFNRKLANKLLFMKRLIKNYHPYMKFHNELIEEIEKMKR